MNDPRFKKKHDNNNALAKPPEEISIQETPADNTPVRPLTQNEKNALQKKKIEEKKALDLVEQKKREKEEKEFQKKKKEKQDILEAAVNRKMFYHIGKLGQERLESKEDDVQIPITQVHLSDEGSHVKGLFTIEVILNREEVDKIIKIGEGL